MNLNSQLDVIKRFTASYDSVNGKLFLTFLKEDVKLKVENSYHHYISI